MSPSACHGQSVRFPTFQSEGWMAKSCSEHLCNASAEAFGDDSIPKPIDRKKRWLQKIKDFKSGACRRILPTSMRVRCLHSLADAEGLL